MRIKGFFGYLLEKGGDDTATNLMRNLSRNYETKRMFYTDLVQYSAEEERRDWKQPKDYVKLEKPITHEAHYFLVFKMDNKGYKLKIDFDFTFEGTKERDAPETVSDENSSRLNIVLKDIRLRKFTIESQNFNFSGAGDNMEDSLKKTVTSFIAKMLSNEYDTLGGEIYSLEQK